ncbi:MAG TPA: LytTR family DNA-binding domain-containing protein [Gemmatimonadaceae bacterium]|nr:LytTR family DNA-binding domain-containing protein [Gemmatimonadaceae bacterium]
MSRARSATVRRPVRVLVVDDEPPALAGMRALLGRHEDMRIVGEAGGGRAAIRAIRSLHPDLVFLDVQMPEVDGFDVLRAVGLDAIRAMIFVTAYDTFAVRAFEVRAIDYLLKPVSEERFDEALDRARRSIAAADDAALATRIRALLDEHAAAHAPALESALPSSRGGSAEPYAARLLVRMAQRDVLIPVADIDWIGADDYCAVLHSGRKRHLVRETLGALEARLDPRAFVRIHRSAIVNMACVTELRRHPTGGVSVVLRDGTRLPVSRGRRAKLDAVLGASR